MNFWQSTHLPFSPLIKMWNSNFLEDCIVFLETLPFTLLPFIYFYTFFYFIDCNKNIIYNTKF